MLNRLSALRDVPLRWLNYFQACENEENLAGERACERSVELMQTRVLQIVWSQAYKSPPCYCRLRTP